MSQPRHTCPSCGREVAQQGDLYGTPERQYVHLYPHYCVGGRWRNGITVTVATKLRRGRP